MKLSKTKQVIVGLVAGAIIIGIASSGSDDAKDTKTEANTEQKSEKQDDTKKSAAATDAPAIAEASSSAAILFEKPADFRSAFNKVCDEADLDFSASKPQINEGEVNNTFKSDVTGNIAFIGTLNKDDNTVKEITMIGTGDGTTTSGANIIICMAALVGTMEPDLPKAERFEVLKKLGIMTDENVMDLSKTYDHNGLHYFINSSEMMGIWFGVSKK